MINKLITLFASSIFLVSCSTKPTTQSYCKQYAHIHNHTCQSQQMNETDYFLIILVDARHLDYSNSQRFLQTFTKHPANGSKEANVGHAWIYLKGKDSVIEGGHTGEYGVIRPRYVDGIMQLVSESDRNPIRYLWESLDDGVFQKGAGGHTPSYAAKFNITQEQYHAILSYIHPNRYLYRNYSLTGRQCTSFVSQVAALADIDIDTDVTMQILPNAKISCCSLPLWEDARYASITFASPDILEKNLIEKVKKGEAECAISWYQQHTNLDKTKTSLLHTLEQFPYRYQRHRSTF
ncbi:MAG: hypothetical protein AAGG81_03945 [Chlamydiota bacterium]